ncbi:DsbA family protein [Usitatibacter rugosus]|nr:thioredoxin domain-containing protein [Usitatibacter rugosus]
MNPRILATLALPLFLVLGTNASSMPTQENANRLRALASEHSPQIGPADAKVHIVEFLDPACEACAAFYPGLKKLMAAHPGRVRLSVRHVPFHRGAEPVARMLEAARAQDKYVPALEALLASQDRWTRGHVANADQALGILKGVGLDVDRLKRDMGAPEITRRLALDMEAAKTVKVSGTPEFFVNGRSLAQPGPKGLEALIREEVALQYPRP